MRPGVEATVFLFMLGLDRATWHDGRWRAGHTMDRFWAKVQKAEGDGCWLWTAGLGSHGYGQFSLNGRPVLAHRLAWELTNGPIPPETPCVLHDCPGGDNQLCVRHLWLGTHADNVADMVAKGRNRSGPVLRGADSPHAKLTEAKLSEVRSRVATGEPQRSIARAFGVSQSTVGRWVRTQ